MWIRFSKKLAGCIAIELLAVAGLWGARYDYRAGFATAGSAQALAIEDERGTQIVIAQAQFSITRRLSDVAAAELMKAYGLERGAILFRGTGSGSASVDDLITSAAAALGRLRPARLLTTDRTLAVLDETGRCVAMLTQDGSFAAAGQMCGGKTPVRGAIRAAFRTVDLAHGLLQRADTVRAYPMQAIAFGKELTILALAGDVPVSAFAAEDVIVAPFSNDAGPFPDDPAIPTAAKELLERVGR